ncbi:MAG: ATP-binding protein [Actinomycetota bacterium]|nr:ATP-binding protein [Actinomycetota bacterium]
MEQKQLIPRAVLKRILKWVDATQLVALVGSRQVGKTSILRLIIDHLVDSGVDERDIFYFDLEDLDYLDLLNGGVEPLLAYVRAQAGAPTKKYVLIDEIQYLDNPSNLLKRLVDHHSQELKLFVTGSSALNIQKKFKDSLAGRKVTFEVYPLSFSEYLLFKKETKLLEILSGFQSFKPANIPGLWHRQLARHYEDYLVYGGYPGVTLVADPDMKRQLLNDIHISYVRKDVQALFSLENITAFNKLIKLLALRIGNLVNVQEISAALSISRPTVEKYMAVLRDTYICQFITPFFSNKNKEIIKMSKVYFYDTGLRNRIINDFKRPGDRVDGGALIENAVFMNLLYVVENKEAIKFWRTKQGAEVDFVLDGEVITAIEIKSGSLDKTPAGLKSFAADYQIKNALVLNQDVVRKRGHMTFLPHYAVVAKD